MELNYPERRNLLLSYPRSGNTFLRYCVEQTTGKKTAAFVRPEIAEKGGMDTLIAMGMNRMDSNALSPTKENQIVLEKTHEIFEGDELVFNKETGGRLVFVIRDFKESIGRHITAKTDQYEIHTEKYKALLDFYQDYDGDKIVIYYEDLVSKTGEEIQRLLTFLDEYDEEKFNTFVENIDFHRQQSIKTYNTFHTSMTKGENFSFHARHFEPVQIEYMNTELNHPLTQRYLGLSH